MNMNVGTTDRILRITLGLGILGAGLYFKSWLGMLGLIPVITGIAGHCPMYCPLKISTRKRDR
jgi:hypothetical protein